MLFLHCYYNIFFSFLIYLIIITLIITKGKIMLKIFFVMDKNQLETEKKLIQK